MLHFAEVERVVPNALEPLEDKRFHLSRRGYRVIQMLRVIDIAYRRTGTPRCARKSFTCGTVKVPKWKSEAASTALAWP